MEHCHAAVPAKRPQVAKAKRKLTIACGLCLIFITGEIAGGYFSGSLAIMSDAAHMFSDFTSFLIRLLEKIRLPTMPLEFNYSHLSNKRGDTLIDFDFFSTLHAHFYPPSLLIS